MSLHRRIVLSLVVMAIVLVGAGLVLAATMHDFLIGRIDSQLETLPERAPFAFVTPRPGPTGTPQNTRVVPGPLADVYVADVTAQGKLVLSQQSSPVNDPPDLTSVIDDVVNGRAVLPLFRTVRAQADGGDFRAFAVSSPLSGFRIFAVSLDETNRTYARIVLIEIVAGAAVAIVLGVVAFSLLRHGVRPLADVAQAADAIAAGDLSHRVPIASDNTEVGRMSYALNRMLEQIEQSFDQKEESERRLKRFVADASHELRTPLTSVRGYADLWRHGALSDPGDLDAAMRRLGSEGARMSRLVEDLLLLARLDEARELRRSPVDLAVLARDAARDAAAAAPDRPVTVDGPAHAWVSGDEDRLRQVFANLLQNALSHTPAGTAVHIGVEADPATVVVRVRDDGPGLAPELLPTVFDRFVRGDAARTRAAGGSGLGLSLVKSIVEAHGGTVSARSEPGRGAEFTVVVPAPGR